MKVAREKDARIVGKAVFFKCKRKECGFRFSTHVETRPQTLQEIVQGSVKDSDDLRYNELAEYYEWCVNYHRILDKRQRTKWKSEVMKRFDNLEVTKILNADDNEVTLSSKEECIIRREGYTKTKNKIVPVAKKLSCTMNDICVTCLGETKMLREYAPVAYVVEIYSQKFLSFLNKSDKKMHVIVINEGYEFDIAPCRETVKSVPTCLLGYIEGKDEWKKEVELRDVSVFDACDTYGVTEYGDGWVTVKIHNEKRISILVESICVEYII